MARDFAVSLSPEEAVSAIVKEITQADTLLLPWAYQGVLLDDYRVECSSGTLISLIFTKYYVRVGSFVTLVVSINTLLGKTIVHVATGGHKGLLDNFDLGAASSFAAMVERALQGHILGTE
ncbi:MAG: Uncharacterized protein FD169_735 [Bacillota bacterium]|nr:MAG: Uncharacterized protein FD169_735 [Bacillota bacterium]MBS3949328.1 hypothetical protein [Peptococcaceae bacterium]